MTTFFIFVVVTLNAAEFLKFFKEDGTAAMECSSQVTLQVEIHASYVIFVCLCVFMYVLYVFGVHLMCYFVCLDINMLLVWLFMCFVF